MLQGEQVILTRLRAPGLSRLTARLSGPHLWRYGERAWAARLDQAPALAVRCAAARAGPTERRRAVRAWRRTSTGTFPQVILTRHPDLPRSREQCRHKRKRQDPAIGSGAKVLQPQCSCRARAGEFGKRPHTRIASVNPSRGPLEPHAAPPEIDVHATVVEKVLV